MLMRILSYTIAAGGGLGTLAAMVYAGGSPGALLSGFTLWALLPYAALAGAAAIAPTRGTLLATLIVSVVAVIFGGLVYIDALFIHVSSTSALVFVFIPLCQLFAATVVGLFAAYQRRQGPV